MLASCPADLSLNSLGGGFFVLLYFLPIYFQSVQDVTAAQSGTRNLPMILAMSKLESVRNVNIAK
jgi:hypothetical protein